MPVRDPVAHLPTHEVVNVPTALGDQDLWSDDSVLRHWVGVFDGGVHSAHLGQAGHATGREETFLKARQANRHGPELVSFDRFGMRIDTVEFHPAYHDLMGLAVSARVHSFAWAHEGAAGHLGQAALTYIFAQVDGGVSCPMAMTYAAVPSLRTTPTIAETWIPRILSARYDPRDIPADEKTGALLGMFMTEKQGGSDVRANATVAVPEGNRTGPGGDYLLTGHKFFCSAPMCDAFLVLANVDAGLSCFLVPRWRPDGTRNALYIQRLKDKLGNKANASVEMEFQDTHGVMLGDPGRGIRVIIDMVTGNRIFCAMASAGYMRQALVQALHHCAHRRAFQKRLIDQPLMRNVLADMALEVEAALALGLRVARAMDAAASDPGGAALARLGTAIAKYWICKRCVPLVAEALECHGGSGYIEDGPMPRLYREAPLNSIWEGSGNIMCLDVLRALTREVQAVPAFLAEIEAARGTDPRLDRAIDDLRDMLRDPSGLEPQMRGVTERMALAWQAALLLTHAPGGVAEAFCASRLGGAAGGAFGALARDVNIDGVLDRAVSH